jgi:hypothetical protein
MSEKPFFSQEHALPVIKVLLQSTYENYNLLLLTWQGGWALFLQMSIVKSDPVASPFFGHAMRNLLMMRSTNGIQQASSIEFMLTSAVIRR